MQNCWSILSSSIGSSDYAKTEPKLKSTNIDVKYIREINDKLLFVVDCNNCGKQHQRFIHKYKLNKFLKVK